MTLSNGNIFRVTGPLCGEFTGYRWIPLTKASNAEIWYFFWSTPWINGWVNNREAGDLRNHRTHYDVIVMSQQRHGLFSSLYVWPRNQPTALDCPSTCWGHIHFILIQPLLLVIPPALNFSFHSVFNIYIFSLSTQYWRLFRVKLLMYQYSCFHSQGDCRRHSYKSCCQYRYKIGHFQKCLMIKP